MDQTKDQTAGKLKPAELQALRDFDNLPDTAKVNVKVVAAWKAVSVPTTWRWAKQGLLPQPTKTGGSTRWVVGDLRACK